MKTLTQYNILDRVLSGDLFITEVNVAAWFKQFVNKITNTIKKNEKSGINVQAEQMDIKKLTTPDDAIPYDKKFDFILKHKVLGFKDLAQMHNQENKFMIFGKDNKNQIKPKYQWYIYQPNDDPANSIFAAVIVFDDAHHYTQEKTDIIILDVETSGGCGNSEEVLNFIWDGWTKTIKKENKDVKFSFYDRKQAMVTSRMKSQLHFKKDSTNPLVYVCEPR